MEIKIQTTDNAGFIITYPHPNLDDKEAVECFTPKEAYQDAEIQKADCKCAKEMLYTVLEAVGIYHSDHAFYNVVIKVEDSEGKEVE